MPLDIKGYRVFIASPGGLEEERRAFRDTLVAYNEAEALHHGAMFLPVGWEDTLGGVGRPQSIINDDLRKCDLFVLLLWDRWGSSPGGEGKYTSGTEEEFHVALECLRDVAMPMRQIIVIFKAVDPRQLSDPGPSLARVLQFKKQLERDREHLYQTFDTIRAFEELLRRHLGAWLRASKQTDATPPSPPAITNVESTDAVPFVTEPRQPETVILEEAERLADEGRRTEAEALYARATVGSNDPRAFIAYGQFLIRDGRYAQAITLLQHARESARATGDDQSSADTLRLLGNVLDTRGELDGAEQMYRKSLEISERLARPEGMADAYVSLGNVLYTRGALDGAEQMYRRSLEINERLGRQEGMAGTYNSLGNVLDTRGDLDGAEQMYRHSLEINERLGRQEGMADAYNNLGNVLDTRGDLDGAEQMYRQSLEINERLGRQEGIANAYGNIGLVLSRRGELDAAEQMYHKSLEIEERLGRQEGMANAYGNLGLLLQKRGDLDAAEQMHRKSLEIEERLGRQEGLASASGNLGNVLFKRGDLDGAEQMHRKALEINERLGRVVGMANNYANLGLVLQTRGDLVRAEQMYRKALELYRRVGMPNDVTRIDALLRELPTSDDSLDGQSD